MHLEESSQIKNLPSFRYFPPFQMSVQLMIQTPESVDKEQKRASSRKVDQNMIKKFYNAATKTLLKDLKINYGHYKKTYSLKNHNYESFICVLIIADHHQKMDEFQKVYKEKLLNVQENNKENKKADFNALFQKVIKAIDIFKEKDQYQAFFSLFELNKKKTAIKNRRAISNFKKIRLEDRYFFDQ